MLVWTQQLSGQLILANSACQAQMPTFSTSSQVVAELSHTQGSATAPQPQTVCPHQIQAQEAQAASPSSQQAACSTRKSVLYSENVWPRWMYFIKMINQNQCWSPLQTDIPAVGKQPAVLEMKRPGGDIKGYPWSPTWSLQTYSSGEPHRCECAQGEIQGSRHSSAVPFYSTHSITPCAKWPQQAALAGVIKAFTLWRV